MIVRATTVMRDDSSEPFSHTSIVRRPISFFFNFIILFNVDGTDGFVTSLKIIDVDKTGMTCRREDYLLQR